MSSATLTVLSSGVSTLVVDGGRPRTRGLGVPVGGAADPFAFALGNLLVGNPPGAAAMEVALGGPSLVATVPLACVLCGAPFDLHTERRSLSPNATFTLEPGETLRIGGTREGARAYLCVQGGIDAPVILDSRTALSPLKAGDAFGVKVGRIGGRGIGSVLAPRRREGVRLLPAAQSSWFPEGVLAGKAFHVSPASNRMGMRLIGEPLPMPAREIASEPVCPGTVQATRDGQCIILGVDGQTIGGYPKVAQVLRADLGVLGQLRPGDEVRFAYVSLDEAEEAIREQAAMLRRWTAALDGPS